MKTKGLKDFENNRYEKRKTIKVGDILEFQKRPDFKKTIQCRVVALHHFTSFQECFVGIEKNKLGINDIQTAIEEMYEYYSKQEENKLGVVGIEFIKT